MDPVWRGALTTPHWGCYQLEISYLSLFVLWSSELMWGSHCALFS